MQNYISVQVGCLRFLDSYRFLGSSPEKLVENQNEFPIMDSSEFSDELLNQKLAYPYEYLNLQNMNQELHLTKQSCWSTLTESFAGDKDIEHTNSTIKKYKLTNGQQLTVISEV